MSVVLPESFLKCVSPADREKLRLGLTAKEFMAKGAAANERSLQRQIVNLLRLKGIEPIVSAMHKRTSNNLGTPDILFACKGVPMAWEVKMPGKDMEPHQQQMALRLMQNGWFHRVIRSVDEALEALRAMGVE